MSLYFAPACVSCDIQVFQTVHDIRTLNPVVDLLESIRSLLKHLDVYNKVPLTAAITGIVVKTLVELFSIFALATNLINQGRPGTFLLAEVLSDSMKLRKNGEDAFWVEARRDGARKAGSTHPRRNLDDCSADPRGRLWSCPAHKV
jgi:hypothetical protein